MAAGYYPNDWLNWVSATRIGSADSPIRAAPAIEGFLVPSPDFLSVVTEFSGLPPAPQTRIRND